MCHRKPFRPASYGIGTKLYCPDINKSIKELRSLGICYNEKDPYNCNYNTQHPWVTPGTCVWKEKNN